MSRQTQFVRPKMERIAFDALLREKGKILIKMNRFNCLEIVHVEGEKCFAYFGMNDTMLVDNVNEKGLYRVNFQRPLDDTGHTCTRLSWEALEDAFFMLPNKTYFDRKPRIQNIFLQPGAIVKTTEETQFMYVSDKKWSPYFPKGMKFKVMARDEHTSEIILQPQGGGRTIQLHLTNAHFFQEVPEQSPEDLPAKDGAGKAEVALASEVKEMKALLQEQSQLLDFQEQQYERLFKHKTSLTRRIPQGTGAREFQEQAQLLKLQEERYQKLFTIHQTSLNRRFAEATGAREQLPSSIIQELLQGAMCPFLADTPDPSDTGVLQNGQLVSRSSWNTYVSKLPENTTPLCPFTREEITQKKVITCPSLQFFIEVLQRMDNEQQKKSADVHDDEAPSHAKKRKL